MIKFAKLFFCFFIIGLSSNSLSAKNIWIVDKELSEIKFTLPILMIDDVKGSFKTFDGFAIIDFKNKENNRAFFSVQISSMDLNYENYINLLLSNIFFNVNHFPIALIDAKKFTISEQTNSLKIDSELQIKDITQIIPLNIEINKFANNLVNVKGKIDFSRTSFELGKDNWSSTMVLRDKIKIDINLFLEKE